MRFRLLYMVALLLFSGTLNSQDMIRVMTYNIKYDAKNDSENNWAVRKPWVDEILKEERPDVLGIQEGLLNQVKDIQEVLGPFQRAGVGREDGMNGGEFSAIFFDTTRFILLNSGTFWLSETPDIVSVGWDAALPRVSTFVELQIRGSQKSLVVYNAHLDHIGAESRRNAMKLILIHAKQHFPSSPLVVMGDFNFTDEDSGYDFLTDYPLIDSRTAVEVFGPKETFNGFNWDQKPEVRIDYIFTSRDLQVEKHQVITTSFPMRYPSDHFPVVAELKVH